MPKIAPYDAKGSTSYALGLFASFALLDNRPELCERLLIANDVRDSAGVAKLVARCEALGIRWEIAGQALARISQKENCHAAMVFRKAEATLSSKAPHVVLVGPSDRGNLGTILRTCLGFGLTNIGIIRPSVDAFEPRCVRASMGAIFGLNLSTFSDFATYRAQFPAHALFPFCLSGAIPLEEAALNPPFPYALVFGNEATGLPAEIAREGTAVRIPHGDAIDSLNLAMAVGIAGYTFTKGGTR